MDKSKTPKIGDKIRLRKHCHPALAGKVVEITNVGEDYIEFRWDDDNGQTVWSSGDYSPGDLEYPAED